MPTPPPPPPQVWNIKDRLLLRCWTLKQDIAVCCAAANPQHTHFCAGDDLGVLTMWDISKLSPYLRQLPESLMPVTAEFRAHETSLVSASFLETGNVVLTAGADGICKLFTVEGVYIGAFGQASPWDLKDPSTYCRCGCLGHEGEWGLNVRGKGVWVWVWVWRGGGGGLSSAYCHMTSHSFAPQQSAFVAGKLHG